MLPAGLCCRAVTTSYAAGLCCRAALPPSCQDELWLPSYASGDLLLSYVLAGGEHAAVHDVLLQLGDDFGP